MINRFALVFFFIMIFSPSLNAAPAAWQVKGENGTLIVFGTMHRLPDGADWLSEDLENSLKNSRLLILETESSQASDDYLGYLIRQPGVVKSKKRLNKRLNNRDYETFLSRVSLFDYNEEEVAYYRPWYAALLLARLGGEEAGLQRGLGVTGVAVSILASFFHSLLGNSNGVFTPTPVTLGCGENFFMLCVRGRASFNSCHDRTPFTNTAETSSRPWHHKVPGLSYREGF